MDSKLSKSLFSIIRSRLIAGILTVLPAVLTIWVIAFIVRLADNVSQPVFKFLIGTRIPGAGLVLTFLVLYLIGGLVQIKLTSRIIGWGEYIIDRVPVAGSIYTAVKQTIAAFKFSSGDGKFRRVIYFQYPRKGLWAIAFVTREIFRNDENQLCLFVPTTPNPTSGFLLMIPENEAVASEMTVEEAAKFIVSGGILTPPEIPVRNKQESN